MEPKKRPAPPPVVWTILYLPFGALSGFIAVGLTFLATEQGLSISEGALINGASLLTQWLKWLWAPAIDVTLTPKRWYVISTALSALGVLLMSAVRLSPSTLGVLLAVIAIASLVNSIVGMAVESLIATTTTPDQAGRVSAWFQAGNLGGGGLGGGLGLYLLKKYPATPWVSGAVIGLLFMACCLALQLLDDPVQPHRGKKAGEATLHVAIDLWKMLRTKGGLLSAILCILPIGTGAATTVVTQATVAAHWGAGAREVELLQGVVAGLVTAAGCFAGGWICQRVHPRSAYTGISFAMALVAATMAFAPPTISTYIGFNLVYAFTVGLSYAAFTAFVLNVMGPGAAATKYNIFASLSNFPLWWLGLLLGYVAERRGASMMLRAEAACGVLGLLILRGVAWMIRRTRLPEAVAPEPSPEPAAEPAKG